MIKLVTDPAETTTWCLVLGRESGRCLYVWRQGWRIKALIA